MAFLATYHWLHGGGEGIRVVRPVLIHRCRIRVHHHWRVGRGGVPRVDGSDGRRINGRGACGLPCLATGFALVLLSVRGAPLMIFSK